MIFISSNSEELQAHTDLYIHTQMKKKQNNNNKKHQHLKQYLQINTRSEESRYSYAQDSSSFSRLSTPNFSKYNKYNRSEPKSYPIKYT